MRVLALSEMTVCIGEEGDDLGLLAKAKTQADLFIAPYIGEVVDLKKEIDGKSGYLVEVARLSFNVSGTVFCGLKTNMEGLKHSSAAVAHRGRLIDIVDRTVNLRGDDCQNSEKIKIYRTLKGRLVTLLVDTDVLLPLVWKKTAEGCDMVVSISDTLTEKEAEFAQTLSGMFGRACLICAPCGIYWSEPENKEGGYEI